MQDYHTFFSCLLRLEPRLESIQAYGTDGERALVNAIRTCFPSGIGLRCFIHIQNNIEERLKGSSSAVERAIVRDVFGYQMGNVYNKGIADASSEEEFDQLLSAMQAKWEKYCLGLVHYHSK